MSHQKKDQPNVGEVRLIVIKDAPTETLLEMRELYRIQLGWGLSKGGRQEVRGKLGAVELTLRDRGVE